MEELKTDSLIGTASAKAPGTCGELAQGMIDGKHFLVTCPIDVYSTASVKLTTGAGEVYGPQNCPKSRRAVELTLDYLSKFEVDANLSLKSTLPRGKGMASSTADVAASINATAAALGTHLNPRQVAEIALHVEPSDGIMFPGIALFDHRDGRIVQNLGAPPPMRIVVLDFGGTVDTVAFNEFNRRDVLHDMEGLIKDALSLITEGIRSGDVQKIGQGATISAVANQELLHKSQLESVLEVAPLLGAIGVNVAHSGSVIGLIFPDDSSMARKAAGQVRRYLHGLQSVSQARVIGGGVMSVVSAN